MTIELIQNDKLFNLTFTVKDSDGIVVNLTSVSSIKFKMAKIASTTLKIEGTCTKSEPNTSGICTYTVQATDLDTVGKYHAEIELTYSDGKVVTAEMDDIEVLKELP